MGCPKCKFENRDRAKFCRECGHNFEIVCPQCETRNRIDSKFCDECGLNLNIPLQTPPTRQSFNEKLSKIQKYLPEGITDKILSQKVREYGENIPPLINSYMSVSPTMKVFGTAINDHFGNVEETAIMIKIGDIYEMKKARHLSTNGSE